MIKAPYQAKSISDLHRLFFLPRPQHPLITVFDLKDRQCLAHSSSDSLVFDFYSIWYKKDVAGNLGYGQRQFDFSTGSYTFQAPGQVISVMDHKFSGGWALAFHPELFRNYPLISTIKELDFFSYDVYQGRDILPDQEASIGNLVNEINKEIIAGDIQFGQPVLVAQLELLLLQFNRYFKRQFHPQPESDFVSMIEKELERYFDNPNKGERGLPTVKYLSERLHLSPHHLSEKLKAITGRSALQHIHDMVIEKGKAMISTTNLSLSEVSFFLGFEHPQSFSKIFKNKTGFTPTAFKNSLCNKTNQCALAKVRIS